ncbi:MAG: alpha/beta fold hydrolase [Pseudomonadota bacterium]
MFETVSGTPFRVRRRAGAPHVVFIHALGTGFWAWEAVANLLPAAWGHTLYDLRGHGLSGGAGEEMAIHAADLRALAPAGAVLAGLSIGAQIAMAAALDAPGRFAGLVLADTAPRIGSVASYADRAARVRADGLAPFAADQVRRWFSLAFAARRPDVVAGARHALTNQPVDGYLAACRAIGACDLTDALPRLDLPVLCLGGSEDVSTPPNALHRLATDLPDATCTIVDGVGHMPSVEDPDAVAAHLIRFVQTCHPTS